MLTTLVITVLSSEKFHCLNIFNRFLIFNISLFLYFSTFNCELSKLSSFEPLLLEAGIEKKKKKIHITKTKTEKK